MSEPNPPVISVTMTGDLRALALDHVQRELDGDERLKWALANWKDGQKLRSDYRIEADMLVVIVQALRREAYLS